MQQSTILEAVRYWQYSAFDLESESKSSLMVSGEFNLPGLDSRLVVMQHGKNLGHALSVGAKNDDAAWHHCPLFL